MDSTATIERVRTDDIGPGQSFTATAIKLCFRLQERDNSVTLCWVPAHNGVQGNEVADEYVRAAAEGADPGDPVQGEYRWETSLPHITRVAAERRS